MRPLLKRVRAYPPINRLATASVRAGARAVPGLAASGERHLPRTGVVRSRLPNGRELRLEGAGDEPWANALFWRGWDRFYEPETLPVFFALASRAAVTLDIGANVGIFTLLAGHANPDGRVHAFEPDCRAYRRLVRHVEINGLANVECDSRAVIDADGEVTLHSGRAARPDEAVAVSAQTSLSRSHVEAEGARVDRIDETRVAAVTIDRFVESRSVPGVDLVKIDVEGAEARVLAGMAETIRRDHPAIVCEVLDRPAGRAIEAVLGPCGYSWTQLTWAGPVPRDRILPLGDGVWPNYLCTFTG
ncbi:MAG: FkbM family methyltransferase [Acidimicrobiia bacterium]|nr:FkbM family methyltransferase [Acidimicrobiia bacterium]